MDLPYRAEYAKSGRSSCKGCKKSIPQGDLRLAAMIQSPMFDGRTPQWYHFQCFFKKQRPKTSDDIEHFESLRVTDQDKIKANVGLSEVAVVPDKKGKKRAGEKALKNAALKDFKIEYAKSGRAMCRGCEQKILKDEIRISKKDFETDVGKKYGGQDMWHHVTCFAQVRSELAYFECGDKLPGFKDLKKEDQQEVKAQVPAIKQEDVPIKKLKTEDAVDGDPKEKQYREQNKIMFQYRDKLKEQMDMSDMTELLEYNKQSPCKGMERTLDHLSDVMTFGALLSCRKCTGQLVFHKDGYVCTGNMTEWTKCPAVEKEPKRVPFKVPPALKNDYPFLKSYKYVPRSRIVRQTHPTTAMKGDVKEEATEPKVKRALPALYDMEFIILGHPPTGKDEIKKQIASLGGKVVTKISATVMAVISTQEEVDKLSARMRDAEQSQIHVVPVEFLDEAKDNAGKIPDLVVKKSICNWGTDPSARLPPEPSTSSSLKSKSRSIYTSSMPSKVKLKLKGGGAVDPDSELEDVAHVYQEGSEKFTVVLGVTDIQTKKNSYYKLQVLAADKGNKYWVFRSWGRIGTTIGGNKTEPKKSLHEAKNHFKDLYEEKSGNIWENHHSFVKVPGKMYPIDIDYGEGEAQNLDIVESDSKLDKPVQDLMKLIFDVNSMKKLMLEFELDTEKMPLGKLSNAQIHKAFGVLSELQNIIEGGGDESLLLDASNRFYTYIPHSFGVDNPPILKDPEVIKQKLEMLDSLMELEIAYNLMKSGKEHTVDSYYSQLNTEISVLDNSSEEYTIIKEYVKNTHAKTHSNYDLEIQEVYTVKRHGEEKRFKPFRKLHNRKLLWHGSRVTNFAGILSQGLRIAPPEAPVTGYMFGKGIYFADMVSKSANYCCTHPANSTGLLLLCDVALGTMYENFHAEYIEKLPKGTHSCKGRGRTEPDPQGSKTIHDNIEVPAGKGKPVPEAAKSSLLYNEYIVYDIAQVNVKYLLKMDFKYKY